MSFVVTARSAPNILLASAAGYQVFATSAPANPEWFDAAPALPSTALCASQARGLNAAVTRISTGLGRSAPQIAAAVWKTKRRCAPRVTPGLPPTGATGVASL